MEQSELDLITQTIEGYEVKELVWKTTDNIIRGLVKDPVVGRETRNNGFVAVTWRKNGSLTKAYGGTTRLDLYLKIN